MKCEQPMCWCCAWRHIIGPGNDPTLSCGHPSEYVRRQFRGSPTARTCKEYVEDDPRIKIKITRDTRETFMRAIRQMAVDSGHFAEAEAILDYFLPDTRNSPAEIASDAFDFITKGKCYSLNRNTKSRNFDKALSFHQIRPTNR